MRKVAIIAPLNDKMTQDENATPFERTKLHPSPSTRADCLHG
jgi:hypothetical protein